MFHEEREREMLVVPVCLPTFDGFNQVYPLPNAFCDFNGFALTSLTTNLEKIKNRKSVEKQNTLIPD